MSNKSTRAAANMEEIVQKSEKRLVEILAKMKEELQASMESIKMEISELKTQVSATEHTVAVHDDEIKALHQEIADLTDSKKVLERQVILKDIHDRKPNLLFYGIAEEPREDTEATLRDFLVNTLNFSGSRADDIYFKTVHRLPKSEYQSKHKPAAPPSIIAAFVRMRDREDVFDAKKLLKDTAYSIQTDLPGLMKKRRAILARQAWTIRQEEKPLWARVRVVGIDVVLETRDPSIPSSPWTRRT